MRKILNFLKLKPIDSMTELPKLSNFTYNYLIGVVMLYMMLSTLSGLMVYKIIKLGPFMVPAGIFTTPITYCLMNVTAEVYGYPVARNQMWWFVFISTIFTGFSFIFIHLPSPPDFQHQSAYDLIFGSMPRVYAAGIIGTILGGSLNTYIVSRLKIKMQAKHYWFRSIVSTCGGEIIYNLIAYPIMLLWRVSYADLMHIFISVTIFKILTTAIFWLPECLLARYLKIKEKINVFDLHVNYNLFKFKIHDDKNKVKLTLIRNT